MNVFVCSLQDAETLISLKRLTFYQNNNNNNNNNNNKQSISWFEKIFIHLYPDDF
jgi:hypothetical protein